MRKDTIQKLNQINQVFYEKVAQDFNASRSYPWPGWERLLKLIGSQYLQPLRVLDIGCGNGRWGSFLSDRKVNIKSYIGVDNNDYLLNQAKQKSYDFKTDFIKADIAAGDKWRDKIDLEQLDLIGIFGVIHHIPGQKNRERLLLESKQRLRQQGLLAVTYWQIEKDDRYCKKRVVWNEWLDHTRMNLDTDDLEVGDGLLNWAGDDDRVRYVHNFSVRETEIIKKLLGMKVVDEYMADGKSEKLNRYVVYEKT